MRTLGLAMMIAGLTIVWVALGKARSGNVGDNEGTTAGGSGFGPAGSAGGGSSGNSGGGSW